ncbi:hypothetical protein DNTS_014863 [Danionella cerebrum]|uniref:Cytospin-A n=1 Tax=Danionella cerebrum TaxID=2873325 RepID=A0A553RI93_9TELE|nr:hypothetical protein DNTS_014863 [Danionella translucida]
MAVLGALGIVMSGQSPRQLSLHHRPSTRLLQWMSRPASHVDSPGSPSARGRMTPANAAMASIKNDRRDESIKSISDSQQPVKTYPLFSSETAADTYETPPNSPYSVVSTWSPKSELVSISKCTSITGPEAAKDTVSLPPVVTLQNEPMLESKKEPEEILKTHPLGKVSHMFVNGNTDVDTKLLEECVKTMQLNMEESTNILNDLLHCFLAERERMVEELRSSKEKIQAEREEWHQFQADLKVALVVSDRLRAEAEEELKVLRATRQDLGSQLSEALQRSREDEGELERLRVELDKSKQKLKKFTGCQQGALSTRAIERRVEDPEKSERSKTQEDPLGLRSLRLHGSSRRNSLLHWSQSRTQGYKYVEITNFSSCWVDGLAFCAIYHSYLPSHIPYDKLSPENKKENLTLAFETGESFSISASLTVEEMLKDDAPDWHRVLEYVENIFRHFEM